MTAATVSGETFASTAVSTGFASALLLTVFLGAAGFFSVAALVAVALVAVDFAAVVFAVALFLAGAFVYFAQKNRDIAPRPLFMAPEKRRKPPFFCAIFTKITLWG